MRWLVLLVVLLGTSACGPTYFGDAVPYPEGCSQIDRDASQCAALVDAAETELNLARADILAVDLLTEDRCGEDRSILCTRSSATAFSVRFTLRGGSFRWVAITCVIDQPRPYC
jgi:hypothetical protein